MCIQYTLYSVQCYSVHYTLYTVQYILYSVHTMYFTEHILIQYIVHAHVTYITTSYYITRHISPWYAVIGEHLEGRGLLLAMA